MKKAKNKSAKTRTKMESTRTETDKTQTNVDYIQTKTEIPNKFVSSPSKFVINSNKSVLSPQKSVSIEWQASEFEYKEKDVSWYWMGLIIAICLLAFSVWQKNFLFAVFVVIAYLAVVYSAGQKPAVWKFTLNEKGVEIDPQKGKSIASRFYKYEEIAGFDIWEKELVLKTKKKISPYLKINFPVEKEKEIKEFLVKHIPKEEYDISISDSFSKLIRF